MKLWLDGNIKDLMGERRTISHHFNSLHYQNQQPPQQSAQVFAKLMMEGKVKATQRVILEDINGGTLHLDRQVAPKSSYEEASAR